ncbi:CHAP domain-containing protein [uncultured Mobiluncus sp.]|uniref:CHAP domain-containing protein n=1 Tax=uncultured Mobiluncus sp. TaxID=293425 RepID=UPI0027D9A2B6|nr:CHAP domain-containing protein [uncultured Mobiluncus sp.]
MISAHAILLTAAREIGYSRWTDPQPGTKYGRDYASRHGKYYGKSGVPFCAMFVTWVFRQCGALPPGGDFAYCPTGIKAMKKLGLEVNKRNAQPGDIVFFDWDGGESDHVGIVEANNGSHLITIEGNTTYAYRSGGVGRRTRSFGVVCNVFRPRYDSAPPAPQARKTIAIDGYFGRESIRALQNRLGTPADGVISSQPAVNKPYVPNAVSGWEWVAHGAKGSTCISAWQKRVGANPDGYFGRETVTKTQQFLGVPADGYAGNQTMTAWQTWINNH